ncbi:hypothetical protein EYF80_040295 [Liparis tanakae]|uniref:Uncharacterized protein n=1 Tax=Liparis tanakae TaxID=230148 RepID=A0A4Z2G8C4_9TELE|nr:hypothetical protein EYF80_040295 [Liparis tanakae]
MEPGTGNERRRREQIPSSPFLFILFHLFICPSAVQPQRPGEGSPSRRVTPAAADLPDQDIHEWS